MLLSAIDGNMECLHRAWRTRVVVGSLTDNNR